MYKVLLLFKYAILYVRNAMKEVRKNVPSAMKILNLNCLRIIQITKDDNILPANVNKDTI